jgi:mono/diheme cytochrome c family protein
MVISKPYGPVLNQGTVGGREGSVRSTIREGETGLMPGFRYALEPAEIEAIIEYLKTVEKPAQPPAYWVAEH